MVYDNEISLVREWWFTDYSSEIDAGLRTRELERRRYYHQSPQIHMRSSLIECLCQVSEELRLSTTTVHLAVYLLDIFMDNHSIVLSRLHLVSLSCVMLAAKFEEVEARVLKVSTLNALLGNRYPVSDFLALEFMLLQFVEFNMLIPTAAHFAEYYAVMATEGDTDGNLLSLVQDFLHVSLQSIELTHNTPSLIAASCVAAARRIRRLQPEWTSNLALVTHYQLPELEPVVKMLFRVASGEPAIAEEPPCKKRLVDSPDHGYASESPTSRSPSHKRNRFCN